MADINFCELSECERVSIEDGQLKLETSDVNVSKYAFYIEYKKELEKRWYTKEPTFKSENQLLSGLYNLSFFYKNKGGVNINRYKIYSNGVSITPIKESILEETYDYKIELYDQNSFITFIVFNSAGSHKKSKAFGLEYLLSKGNNVIACYQATDSFYQGLSLNDFQRIVTPYIHNKKVFLYGSSLGGYCALYYSGVVQGIVIAAAPRNPIHFCLKGLEKNYDIIYKHKELSDIIQTKLEVYVLIDPYVRNDMIFLERVVLPAYPDLKLIEVPFSGHAVLYHLVSTGQLNTIIETIVAGKELVIRSIESEFTIYGQSLNAYRLLFQNIKKLKNYNNLHPLVEKQFLALKDMIKNI